jgi:putative two-component system response regulator
LRPSILKARLNNHLLLKEASDFLQDKNHYLEDEVRRRLEENQMIQDASICALARLAEARDPETGDHIQRTKSYVRVLADYLRNQPPFYQVIDDRFIDLVSNSAQLHDIGKVGIPDHVLLKPGALNPEEWEIMKTHSRIGAQAIEFAERDMKRPIEFLRFAKEVALWHHERWDGKGYPDGLAGEEIPLSARLMALADVFDALITRRVYKPPMPVEKARAVISAEAGSQFDPRTVEAFLATFSQFIAIARQYAEGTQLDSVGS